MFRKRNDLQTQLNHKKDQINTILSWMVKAKLTSAHIDDDIEIMRKKFKRRKILTPAEKRESQNLSTQRSRLTRLQIEAHELLDGFYRDVRELLAVHV